jgi:hypothetical protein
VLAVAEKVGEFDPLPGEEPLKLDRLFVVENR